MCFPCYVEMERTEESLADITQTSDGSAAPGQQPTLVAPQSPALGVSGAQPLLDSESGNGVPGNGESDKWTADGPTAEKTEVGGVCVLWVTQSGGVWH